MRYVPGLARPSASAASSSAASRPALRKSGSTLARVGFRCSQRISSLSMPTSAIWSGMPISRFRHATRTCSPMKSFAASTPHGFGSASIHRLRRIWKSTASRNGLAGSKRNMCEPLPRSAVSLRNETLRSSLQYVGVMEPTYARSLQPCVLSSLTASRVVAAESCLTNAARRSHAFLPWIDGLTSQNTTGRLPNMPGLTASASTTPSNMQPSGFQKSSSLRIDRPHRTSSITSTCHPRSRAKEYTPSTRRGSCRPEDRKKHITSWFTQAPARQRPD